MRIVHLIDRFDPNALYQEGHLAIEQARAGHDVSVITLRQTGQASQRLPFSIQVLPSLPTGRYQRIPVGLIAALGQAEPDAVHAHGLASLMTLIASRQPGRSKYCLVVDSHHSWLNTHQRDFVRRAGASAYRSLIGPSLRRNADHVVAIAQPEREFASWALGMDVETVALIPLGVDVDVFRPSAEQRSAARRELGINPAERVIVHAGRLVPGKGIPEIIEAASGTCSATVLLVGSMDPQIREVLDHSPSTKIVHVPFVEKRQLAAFLNAADVAVWFGLPSLTLLESMAVGLPVIAGSGPHFTSLLGSDGIYARSAVELRAALDDLLADEPRRRALGARLAARIVHNHSWAALSAEFVGLYATRTVSADALRALA